ncbi:hypothetical protein HQO38_18435 [Rhodococcus fascians]|nr:hypothetical protein [Rhodococcus fascians]MBY4233892.1 hypothetical protein [Rhodococcus fascians]MBY4249045.1 hypothetical protein [Rhodococcus fascians]MBY4295564.1 hypothetical protein [Rhodococcus fascians]MBY4315634.1 hypothetical protein [Rhodococcus fascians]
MSAPLHAEHGGGEKDIYGELNRSSYGWVLQDLLARATNWAQTPGPDGILPFDDVSVRTKLAEISVEVELIRNVPGPMGRVLSSDLLIQRSAELVDMIGPEAVIARGSEGAVEEGELEWGHRFAQGTAIYGGTTDITRNIVAQHELGLPRPPKIG